MINQTFNALIHATLEDRAAKREAMQTGVMATRPLSVSRLAQLCALGERMIHAERRKRDAERDVAELTIGMSRSIDLLLPT